MNSWQIRCDSPTLLSGTLPSPRSLGLAHKQPAVPGIEGLLLQPGSPKALRAADLHKAAWKT